MLLFDEVKSKMNCLTEMSLIQTPEQRPYPVMVSEVQHVANNYFTTNTILQHLTTNTTTNN